MGLFLWTLPVVGMMGGGGGASMTEAVGGAEAAMGEVVAALGLPRWRKKQHSAVHGGDERGTRVAMGEVDGGARPAMAEVEGGGVAMALAVELCGRRQRAPIPSRAWLT